MLYLVFFDFYYTLFLCPVLASALFAICNAGTIKNAANNMITNTGQISHSPATDYNRAVLLKVVVDTGDIRRNFLAVCQPHTGDFPQSGVRFLRRLSPDNKADTPLLRRTADIGNPFPAL